MSHGHKLAITIVEVMLPEKEGMSGEGPGKIWGRSGEGPGTVRGGSGERPGRWFCKISIILIEFVRTILLFHGNERSSCC